MRRTPTTPTPIARAIGTAASTATSDVDLAPVVAVLSERFAGVAEPTVIVKLVEDTAAEFENARILDFIPVLVQHRCMDRLRLMHQHR